MAPDIWPGGALPLGATLDEGGVNFAVFSEIADRVELCLFDSRGTETRLTLPEVTAFVHHGYVPGIRAGQRYAYRVYGQWAPHQGLRCNPAKLLLDPYATAVQGELGWGDAVYGHIQSNPDRISRRDSARHMPRAVVTDPAFDWGADQNPRIPLHQTIIYETHVRGLTMTHPDVPPELRGTYAGLASPPILEYLVDLGVTSIELLPVHHFVSEHFLHRRGLRNYWGYNSIAYLAPHGRYSSAGDCGEQVAEFKSMVQRTARGGARSDPRRRLQPHRGRQPPRPDAVAQGIRQPGVLPARRARPQPLHRLHGHRQQPQHAPLAVAAAVDGQPALLDHRDARRRVPVRSRGGAGTRPVRGRPSVVVLRSHPSGSGGQPGQADRRAVGRRRGRLPGRQLSGAVVGVERSVPRWCPRLLARRRPGARRVRLATHRELRPLRMVRPATIGEHQLRHRPRRFHARRPRRLRPQAQRCQRRGQPRR